LLTKSSGEVIGYIGRCINISQGYRLWTLGPYVIQAVFILVAPALFAATVYMQLGRLVRQIQGQPYLFIRATWLTKIFVAGDVVSFLMQGAGGGLESSHEVKTANAGAHIIVGGLFVQIVFFGLFVLAACIFDWKFTKATGEKTEESERIRKEAGYRRRMIALYVISILIFVRSIVRVVEFLQGFHGYVISHEVFIFVFDALPMFTVMVVGFWGL
jgi:hypothetical protein